MSVHFEMCAPPPAIGEDGAPVEQPPMEYVVIDGQGTGQDVICRAATDADRALYAEAYAQFKGVTTPTEG